MRHRGQRWWWLALLSPLLLTGCGFFNSSWPTYRYRLTLNVNTPAGLRSGSSVVEVRTTQQGSWNIDSPGNVSTEVFGEAVAVELPNGQTLFVVNRSDWGSLLTEAYNASIPESEWAKDMRTRVKRARQYRGILIVPAWTGQIANDPGRRVYPTLATFRDISDPATVEEVAYDDLAASFGPGYSLRSITVEVTNDPITTGIQARLPWLEDLRKRDASLDGVKRASVSDNLLSSNLGAGSFQHLN